MNERKWGGRGGYNYSNAGHGDRLLSLHSYNDGTEYAGLLSEQDMFL